MIYFLLYLCNFCRASVAAAVECLGCAEVRWVPSNWLSVSQADSEFGNLCQQRFGFGMGVRAPRLRSLPAARLAGAPAAAEPGLPVPTLPNMALCPWVGGPGSPPSARPAAPGCPAAFPGGEPLRSGVCRQARQGLTAQPHAPFDGVGPTSPNLKRHPGPSVRPGRAESRRPPTPCAGSSHRGSARPGTGLPFGSRSSGPRVPGTPVPGAHLRAAGSRRDPGRGRHGGARRLPRRVKEGGRKENPVLAKMQFALFLSWCCCLHGWVLGTGFLYQFPASTLQHNYPEQNSGSPGSGFASRR